MLLLLLLLLLFLLLLLLQLASSQFQYSAHTVNSPTTHHRLSCQLPTTQLLLLQTGHRTEGFAAYLTHIVTHIVCVLCVERERDRERGREREQEKERARERERERERTAVPCTSVLRTPLVVPLLLIVAVEVVTGFRSRRTVPS